MGRSWTYAYNGTQLQTVTDPEGGVTTYTYDVNNRMTTLKDARNIVFLTNEYDANGRVFRQTQADSTTYQFAYTLDGQGKVTQTDVTDPRGKVRRVTFNAAGYPLSDIRAVGLPEQQAMTYERQAGTNLVTAQVDALSRRTEYTYDAKANVTQVKRLAVTPNAVTTFTYDPTFSQVTTVTDPLTHTTTITPTLGNGRHGLRTGVMSTSMKRSPVSTDTCLCGVPAPFVLMSAVHGEWPHGSREVRSSFYSRSSGASGARRRMRGVEEWGRHLRSGARTAAKSTYALTHPSNLRETRVPLISPRIVPDFSGFGA